MVCFLISLAQTEFLPSAYSSIVVKSFTMSLAPAAAAGFHNASAYDAHRPAYPPSAVQALLTHMRLADKPHARIVEVAAGTGKFTEALAARHEGFEVLAVEPHAEMRAALEAKALSGVTVREGRAETLRAAVVEGEEWADGVVVAQAFHVSRPLFPRLCLSLLEGF